MHTRSSLVLRRAVACAAFVVYLIVLFDLTLTGTVPPGQSSSATNVIPFATIGATVSSPLSLGGTVYVLLGNFLMLSPLAVLIVVAQRRAHALLALITFVGVSVTIEWAQWLIPTGRSVDIDDVLLNSSGALLVYVLLARFFPGIQGWMRAPAGVMSSRRNPREKARTTDR